MASTGRKRDRIWLYYEELKDIGRRKGSRAKCKKCKEEMEGQTERMKRHYDKCAQSELSEDEDEVILFSTGNSENEATPPSPTQETRLSSVQTIAPSSAQRIASSSIQPIALSSVQPIASSSIKHVKKSCATSLIRRPYVVSTTEKEKEELDELVARFIFGSNSSFHLVENVHFIKLLQKLRPGYAPPSRKQISNTLLNSIYTKERSKVVDQLKNSTVSLSLDGWSNIHNDPIVCTSVTTERGDTLLLDTTDTSSNPHTSEYLTKLADESIKKFKSEYEGKVGSIVTDNTNNVAKMRRDLNGIHPNLITNGCSAHLLNLLISDYKIPGVKGHLIKIIKYFRNNHFASSKYKELKAKKLILPSATRWNSFVDALEIYIQQWPQLVAVCEDNRDRIDKNIQKLVLNMVMKRNCEDLFARMKPVAVALDRLQRTDSTIADSVQVWKILEAELECTNPENTLMASFKARYDQAISPPHLLSNLLHPVYLGEKLTSDELNAAMKFAAEISETVPTFLPMVQQFRAQAGPFIKELFNKRSVEAITALDWWKCLKRQIDKDAFEILIQMLTSSSSTAGLERLFSTFGIVHSDIRNRLGTEKAAKLVFLLKTLNAPPSDKIY